MKQGRILRFVSRMGVARGFLGGSRAWTLVATVVFSIRAMKKLLGGTPDIAYSEQLRPGDCLVITNDREARIVRAPS